MPAMLLQARVFFVLVHFRFPWLGGPRHLCAKLGIYTSPAFISSSVAVSPLFSWYRADFSDTFVGHGGFDVATFWPEMGGRWDAVLGLWVACISQMLQVWNIYLHISPKFMIHPIVKVGALVWICGLPMGGAFWKVVAFAACSCTTMQVLAPDMAHAINNTCLQDAAFSCWLVWTNWNHATVQKTHTHTNIRCLQNAAFRSRLALTNWNDPHTHTHTYTGERLVCKGNTSAACLDAGRYVILNWATARVHVG